MAIPYTVRMIDKLLRFDTTADDILCTLLPFAQTPNAPYEVHKVSFADDHIVTIRVDPATSDFLLADGSTFIVLDDDNPTAHIQIPHDAASPAFVTMGAGAGGPTVSPQRFWRVFDIHKTTVGNDVGPVVTAQGTGRGIKITGVLRKAITADLVVRVNVNAIAIGTLTIPSTTAIDDEVFILITTKHLVQGQSITWDITGSDGSFDANGVATVTVEWGVVTEVTVIDGAWQGPYDPSAHYATGEAVQFDGSSYVSLQDDNFGNTPDPAGTVWWDLVALKGDTGAGVPPGGTDGQVLTKQSGTDYDADWEDPLTLPLTTVGDLLAYDGDNVRFPVGDDADVLTADSTQATGLIWTPTKIAAQEDGLTIGTRHALNFIGVGLITISVVDDPANNRVNIYIGTGAISTGGGSVPVWSLIGFGHGTVMF